MSTTTMPVLSHLPAVAPGAVPPAGAPPQMPTKSAPPIYAPLLLAGGSDGGDAFQSLGLRRPNASGDIAALLARVAMESEEREGENRGNRLVNGFATLAAGIASTELKAMRARVDALRDFSQASETNLDETRRQAVPLRGELDAENARVAVLRGEVATLRAMLEDPALPPEQAGQVQQLYLAAVQSHATAMEARDGIAIDLAEATILALDRDVAALEAYLGSLPATSPERSEVAAQLSAQRAEAEAARQQLAGFRAADPKTDAMRDQFAAGVAARADALLADLGQQSADASEKHDGETRKLGVQSADALAVAARAAAAFRQAQTGRQAAEGARDVNFEKLFELIAGEAADADARIRHTLTRMDEREAGRVGDERERRIADLSTRLLDSLSTLLSTLSQMDAEILAPPAPMAGRRMRFGV